MRIRRSNHTTLAKRACTLFASALLFCAPLFGSEINEPDTLATANSRESLFPQSSRNLSFSHFTWGAEAGASIDVSGYDMSTFDIDVLLGYKNKAIRMLGIGVGVHRSVQVGDNFIPIYATIQTSFRSKPSLCFFSAKIGYSFNTIGDSPTFGDTMSSLGCGINLSQSHRAKSYLLLSAGYRYFNNRHIEAIDRIDRHYIFIASLALGISF